MATLTKTLTVSSRTVSIANGVVYGSVRFTDEKGNRVGQSSVSIKGGKIIETGESASSALVSAAATLETEFAKLVEVLVSNGKLDPMAQRAIPTPPAMPSPTAAK